MVDVLVLWVVLLALFCAWRDLEVFALADVETLSEDAGGWLARPRMVIFVWLLGGGGAFVDDASCSPSFQSWRSFENCNVFLSGFDDSAVVSEAAVAAAAAAVDTLETTEVTVDRSTAV